MKVYVLGDDKIDGVSIKGIYSTKEKAIQALPYHEYLIEDDIAEIELDPPNKGEIYEQYYYCRFDPNVPSNILCGMQKRMATETPAYQFGRNSSSTTIGWGKSAPEAEENARKAQLELHPVWQVFVDDTDSFKNRYHLSHPSMIYSFSGRKAFAVHEDFNIAKIAIMEYVASCKLSPYLTVAP